MTPDDYTPDPGSPQPRPLAPPTQPVLVAPVAQRSKWPAVVGIIAIVIGAGGFLFNACGSVGSFVVANMLQSKALPGVPPEVLQVRPVLVAVLLVMSLLCGVLLIPGIALLKRRPWSVPGLRIWSVAAIVLAVVASVIEARVQTENVTRMMTATSMPAGVGPSPLVLQTSVIGGVAFNAVLRCSFPVFLLIWFTRCKIRDDVVAWKTPAV